MVIPADLSSLSGKSVYLKFISPLGFVADEYRLPIRQPALPVKTTNRLSSGTVKAQSNDRQITIKTGGLTVNIDKQTGLIHQANRDSNTLLIGGPLLMVLALNGSGDTQMTRQMKPVSFDTAVRSNRKVEQVSLTQETDTAAVTITDSYDIARGTCKLTIDSGGIMVIDYDYVLTAGINPRQYGIVMTLPGSFTQLHWQRKGLWTVYPEDHIARLEGTTDALVGVKPCGIAGPSARPDYPWYHDTNTLGTNDFRSTKENIIHAYLSSSSTRGPVIESDGNQHVRCWIDGDVIRMLIAEYNNPGAEGFFRSHAALEDKPLKAGDKISGSVKFRLLDN